MKSHLSLTLAIATVAVAGLQGCPATAPLMANQSSTASSSPSASTSPGASAMPSTAPSATPSTGTAATTAFTDFKGNVSLNGTAFANVTLKVQDAVAGTEVTVLGPGASPSGANLGVDGTSLKTDANGNFDLKVANVTANTVLRIVAVNNGQTLTAIITGKGDTPKKYSIDQAAGGSYTVNLDPTSTALAAIAQGVLNMAKALKPDAAIAAITNMMVQLNAAAPKIDAAFKADPSLATKVAQQTPASPTDVVNTSVLGDTITAVEAAANVQATVNQAVKDATTNVAQSAANKDNVVDAAALNNVTVVGAKVSVAIVNGNVVVTDTATGQSVSVALPTSTGTTTGTTTGSTTGSSGGSGGGSGGSGGGSGIVDTTTFNPSATVTFNTSTKILSIVVTQAAGEQDIQTVTARIAASDVTLNTGTASAHDSLGLPTMLTDTGSTVKAKALNDVDTPLIISTADADATSAADYALPAAFGSTTLSGPGYDSYLDVAPNTKVATFEVFTNKTIDSTAYDFLALKYNPSFIGATTNQGHTTTINTKAFTAISGSTVDVVFTARGSSGKVLVKTGLTITKTAL